MFKKLGSKMIPIKLLKIKTQYTGWDQWQIRLQKKIYEVEDRAIETIQNKHTHKNN